MLTSTALAEPRISTSPATRRGTRPLLRGPPRSRATGRSTAKTVRKRPLFFKIQEEPFNLCFPCHICLFPPLWLLARRYCQDLLRVCEPPCPALPRVASFACFLLCFFSSCTAAWNRVSFRYFFDVLGLHAFQTFHNLHPFPLLSCPLPFAFSPTADRLCHFKGNGGLHMCYHGDYFNETILVSAVCSVVCFRMLLRAECPCLF